MLGPGDCLVHPGTIAHRWTVEGDDPVRLFLVVLPRPRPDRPFAQHQLAARRCSANAQSSSWRRRAAAFSTARRAWVSVLSARWPAGRTVGDGLLQEVERDLVELGADGLQLVGEVAVAGHGSRGRPSTRSPRMLCWISSVPPAMRIAGAPREEP